MKKKNGKTLIKIGKKRKNCGKIGEKKRNNQKQ